MTEIIRFDIKPTEQQLKTRNPIGYITTPTPKKIVILPRTPVKLLSVDESWLRKSTIYRCGLVNLYIVDGGLKRYLYKYLLSIPYDYELIVSNKHGAGFDMNLELYYVKNIDLNKSNSDMPMLFALKNPD